jgi:uncharacterized protein
MPEFARRLQMPFRSTATKSLITAIALGLSIQPALADVKAGVDAWTRGDYAAAVKEWREPALKGDADAQFNMGQAYKLGRGVKADLDVAADWYRKAASQGHLQASDSYGHLLHYRGKVAEAMPYLQGAADRGEPRSQYLLGTELFNGTYIAKDWVRAYALMTRASASGLAPASRSLAQMDQYIPLEQRQQGIALAGQLESRAKVARAQQTSGFPINTAPPKTVTKPVPVPASTPAASYEPAFPGDDQPMPGDPEPTPLPAPRAKPVAKPAPVRAATPAARPAAATGGWRIQLGAFGEERNARRLWESLEGRVSGLSGLTPYLKAVGSVTRLQAGPFASRSAAEAMCSKVKASGQACIAVQG